jgi:hypothetical protein
MALRNKTLWTIFLAYILISGYTMAHHEPWGDEVHSWNIAKGSGSYPQLIENRRFEGHPPVWYTILWSISKLTHNIGYVQTVQWIIACLVAWLIIFYSPFPTLTKILFCFGYYFLFEYAILSRNYGVGVLFICCICLLLKNIPPPDDEPFRQRSDFATSSRTPSIRSGNFRYRIPLYYVLLFLLSNVHLLAMLLAASLHLYFLLSFTSRKKLLTHIVIGGLIFLPAALFIFPPSDSTINMGFWLHRWDIHRLTATVEGPLRAFLPIQAWWNYHFWNTEFLLEAKSGHSILKVVNLLCMISLIALAFFILRKSRKSLILFGTNLLLTFIVSASVFSLTSARYAGFIFIGFFAACWLHYYEQPISNTSKKLLYSLLVIQLAAGAFAVFWDIRLPFSNLYRIDELVREVPAGEHLVTDYWTMNGYVAYLDKPAYCVDMDKEISFVTWGPDMTAMTDNPHRYTFGLQRYFHNKNVREVYLLTLGSPQVLDKVDSAFSRSFHLHLIDSRQGAIEKGSDLYLYKVTQ